MKPLDGRGIATHLAVLLLTVGLIMTACTGSGAGDGTHPDTTQAEDTTESEQEQAEDPTDEPVVEPTDTAVEELDYTLPPNFGEVDLEANFLPDPYTVDIISGGTIDASYLDNPDCYGYATSAPDFRVHWSGDSAQLRFFFVGEDGDTTLIINDPSTDWYCNDDSFGTLDPTVTFDNPDDGQYDIWIGSYSSGEFVSGTLYVTEIGYAPDNLPNGTTLDYTLPPNFGEVDLEANFLPDPYTVDITSGGTIDASYLDNPDCLGYATSAPDFRVHWSGDSAQLRFFFVGVDGDTTLIINGPDTEWYCNDDSFNTTNPTITFNNPAEGQFDIWIGSYSSGEFVSGTLNITELDLTP